MAELNNNQIETLRLGLKRAFVNFDRLDFFLREKLGKRLNFYAGREDAFPIAIFKLITEGALAEGWIEELVSKAYRALMPAPQLSSHKPWLILRHSPKRFRLRSNRQSGHGSASGR